MTFRASLGSLRLDPLSAADARALYRIRMHPSVRHFMSNPALIPFRRHLCWFNAHLQNPNNLHIWLVRSPDHAHPIGLSQLRVQSDTAEIGVMFRDPEHHRLSASLITVATLHLAFDFFHLPFVHSYIIPGHADAIAYNLAWGAARVDSDKPPMVKLILDRATCSANANYARILRRIQNRLTVTQEPPSHP